MERKRGEKKKEIKEGVTLKTELVEDEKAKERVRKIRETGPSEGEGKERVRGRRRGLQQGERKG